MKYALITLLLTGCYGCVEDTSMYIDTRCTQEERAAIYETVDYVNKVAGYQAIEIGGYEKGVYGHQDPLDRILCVPESYDMCRYDKNGKIVSCSMGLYRQDDVYVASYLIEDIQIFKNVLLHEFGHRLIDSGPDVDDHVGMTPEDVMYLQVTNATEYTDRDRERIFGHEQ